MSEARQAGSGRDPIEFVEVEAEERSSVGAAMAAEVRKRPVDTTSIMSDMHVLLVDDQKVIRTILRGMLRDMGVTRVAEASDGAEALEFLIRPGGRDVDLVVCDLHMEGMDGLDFCNRLRRDDTLHERHIPILMLTGETSNLLLDTVRQVGAADVAAKPISPVEFRQRIENLLGLRTG